MFLSLRPQLCSLPSPGGLSPCASLRNCQAKVTWLDRSWLAAQTHLHKVTPLRGAVLRGWWLLQASVPDEGGEGEGMGGVCWLALAAARALAAGVPCGLGGRGPLPQGAGWLRWEQIVFTPSPHTQPTLPLTPRGSPTPGLSAHPAHLQLLSCCGECPPSAERSSREGRRGLGAPSSATGSLRRGCTQCLQEAASFPHPTSSERAAACEWEQEAQGLGRLTIIGGKGLRATRETAERPRAGAPLA